jgi:CspA family cold shock protein
VHRFHDAPGFGWLRPDAGGPDVFVHAHVIRGGPGRKTQHPGQCVEFEIEYSERGPRARNVLVVEGGR